MNVNFYFIYITIGLAMIYIFFNPMKLQTLNTAEVAQLELTNFKIYDLDKDGLKSVFSGTRGYRYLDRYEVFDINYTDNSKVYVSNIKSNFGVYKNYIVNMNGNLVYTRADGLTYKSNDGNYNQQTGILRTEGEYLAYRDDNKVIGNSLVYDSKTGQSTSKKVFAIYQIK